MKHRFADDKVMVVLTAIASLLVVLTVIFTFVPAWRSPTPTVPPAELVTRPTSVTTTTTTTTLRTIEHKTQDPMVTMETTYPTTLTTTPATTSTDEEGLPVVPEGYYSHINVFLDRQTVVMYHTDENDEAIPVVSFYCSTGASVTPTPKAQDFGLAYFRIGLRGALYYKWKNCFVRYPTQFFGDYFFHSIPYYLTENGRLDKGRMSIRGYQNLGQTALSEGCVRLCLRDAKYLSDNTYTGMPVFVHDSSAGYTFPKQVPLLPLKDYRSHGGWDPTDPEGPYHQSDFEFYSVTYDANGAEGSVPVDSNRYIMSTLFQLRGPGSLKKDGYVFAGWSLKKTPKEGETLKKAESWDFMVPDMVLYAQWKKIGEPETSFSVQYDANGGEGALPSDTRKYKSGDVAQVLDGASLLLEGKMFSGWKADDGTLYMPGDSLTVTKNITLTAQWESAPTPTTAPSTPPTTTTAPPTTPTTPTTTATSSQETTATTTSAAEETSQ